MDMVLYAGLGIVAFAMLIMVIAWYAMNYGQQKERSDNAESDAEVARKLLQAAKPRDFDDARSIHKRMRVKDD